MKIKIRYKLLISIIFLIILSYSFTATLFIKQEKKELEKDILLNTASYAEITAPEIINNFEIFYLNGSFIYFNREINKILERTNTLQKIQIASFAGELLYDSATDTSEKFQNRVTQIQDEKLIEQIKSRSINLRDQKGKIYSFNEFKENPEKEIVNFIVVPVNERYSIIYFLDYSTLEQRIEEMIKNILYLIFITAGIGIFLSIFLSRKITKPISKLTKQAEKIAQGNFRSRVEIKTEDEVGALGKTFNKMAKGLEKSIKDKLYKERVTNELALAKEIQNKLIPKELPNIPNLEISAGLIPAEEIGGDIYDFIHVNDDRFLMYLGDVTGHGVPSGIVSSISNALFFGFGKKDQDLKTILKNVNSVLDQKTSKTIFVTVCLLEYLIPTKTLQYCSAGHEQIIHYQAKSKKAHFENSEGIALGMIENIENHLKVKKIDCQKDDILVIYSDGIPEAKNTEDKIYSKEKLLATVEKIVQKADYTSENKAVSKNKNDSARIKDEILNEIKEYSHGTKQNDDITLIVIKIKS